MVIIGSGIQPVEQQATLRGHSDEQIALREACQEFAAVFWQQVLSGLRRTVPKGGLFPESAGEETFKSMLDTEYARAIARSEGSLAEVLFRQLAYSCQNSTKEKGI
jgi:flagellar protein FlgJ